MHEYLFADAMRPKRAVCLRLPLKPYSIGHELLLLRERNPLLTDTLKSFEECSRATQAHALMRAVLICASTWQENHKPQRWLRLWEWRSRGCDLKRECQVFREYLADGHAGFPAPDEEAESIVAKGNGYQSEKELRGRAFGTPLISRLMLFVSARLTGSFADVYDFPLARANLLYEAHLESEGSARIENRDELDEKENLAEIRRQVREEQKARAKSEPSGVLSIVPEELKEGSAG